MIQLLILLAAVQLLVALLYLAFHHQRWFLCLYMLLTALAATRDFAPTLGVTISGVHVYPEDLFTVVATIAGLAHIRRWQLLKAQRLAAVVFAALVCLGVVAWIGTYGLQTGVNSWRSQMLALALFLYTTTRRRLWEWLDLRAIVVAPALLAAVASVLGLAAHGIGSSADRIQVNGVLADSRPLAAPGALLLLAALWITGLSPEGTPLKRTTIVVPLAGMLLLTQQRSVWAATVLSVGVWWLAPRVHRLDGAKRLAGIARTLIVLSAAVLTALVTSSLAAIGQSASNDSTWLWRVNRWGESMSIRRSWMQWLAGAAFGPTPAAAPTRFLTSAHSTYVDAIEMIGLLGLLVIVYLVVGVRRAHIGRSSAPIGLVSCFALMGFATAYQLVPWTWILIGFLLSRPSTSLYLPQEDTAAGSRAGHLGPALATQP